jgi:hypothetical protein
MASKKKKFKKFINGTAAGLAGKFCQELATLKATTSNNL